jgi:hypothetical protein
MPNPFSKLDAPIDESEQWGGRFECFTFKCLSFADIADYNRATKRLTWTCADGHKNKKDDVEDD